MPSVAPQPAENNQPVTVYLLSQQRVHCEALARVVASFDHVDVVGSASMPADLGEIAQLKPDVVLLDGWCVPEGVRLCREIRERCPESKIVALSSSREFTSVVSATKAGVEGYVAPNCGLIHLERCLLDVRRGGDCGVHVVFDPSTLLAIEAPSTNGLAQKLSTREIDILRLMAGGASNQEVARRLYVSRETVKSAISSLFRKLEVADRTQAVAVALRAGALD